MTFVTRIGAEIERAEALLAAHPDPETRRRAEAWAAFRVQAIAQEAEAELRSLQEASA